MSQYRFVGAYCEIGVDGSEAKLETFGQKVELSDELAKDVIGTDAAGGAAIVPEAMFDEIGFTEQELSLYSNPLTHAQANTSTWPRSRPMVASQKLRTHLSEGGTIATLAPKVTIYPVQDKEARGPADKTV